jgi:hypothetical protein
MSLCVWRFSLVDSSIARIPSRHDAEDQNRISARRSNSPPDYLPARGRSYQPSVVDRLIATVQSFLWVRAHCSALVEMECSYNHDFDVRNQVVAGVRVWF